MKRRRLVLLSLAVASLALAAGTGAFTAMSADRGVDVRVADDDSAYIGIEKETPTITAGTSTEILMTLENNFPDSSVTVVDFEATISNSKSMVNNVTDSWSGGSGEVSAEINCSQPRTESLTFDINIVTDGGVSVSLTRSVKITCTDLTPTETATETETNTTTSGSESS